MAANEVELVDPLQLPVISDYQFIGDSETVSKKYRVVEGYRLKASIFHAAQYARCARASIYRWMESDPEFAQAMADSHEDAADIMETSTYEEALGTKDKPGNPLLKMFWLKAHRHKFRDKVTIDIPSVQDEIEQRMSQLGIRELPALNPQSLSSDLSGIGSEIRQFPSQPEQIQKDLVNDNPTQG